MVIREWILIQFVRSYFETCEGIEIRIVSAVAYWRVTRWSLFRNDASISDRSFVVGVSGYATRSGMYGDIGVSHLLIDLFLRHLDSILIDLSILRLHLLHTHLIQGISTQPSLTLYGLATKLHPQVDNLLLFLLQLHIINIFVRHIVLFWFVLIPIVFYSVGWLYFIIQKFIEFFFVVYYFGKLFLYIVVQFRVHQLRVFHSGQFFSDIVVVLLHVVLA